MSAGAAAVKVGIVDYRMGNLASVAKAIEAAGGSALVSDRADELDGAGLLVLPGVGHFGAGMDHLAELGLTDFVTGWAASGRPLLGVCVGMQLLFEASEESPAAGLGVLPGRVARFGGELKVPHMGWNTIASEAEVFRDFSGRHFYFVHSYYCIPADEATVVARTGYGVQFAAAVRRDSVWGVQFHPEKSSDDGVALYRRLIEEIA